MSGTGAEQRSDAEEAFEFVEAGWDFPQVYRADPLLFRFFDGLKQKRLLASTTGDRVIFPPVGFCEVTFREATDLVPVGPEGVIRAITVLPGEVPKALVYVQLDGADTAGPGYLRGVPADQLQSVGHVGARCRAVFADEPKGDWTDFWFERT